MPCIHGSLLMGHAHVACAVGELRQSRHTASGAARVLHVAPAACKGREVMAPMGRYAREAHLPIGVLECRVKLVRPMEPAALDDPHDRCVSCAEDGPPWMARGPQRLGLTVEHACRADGG